MPGVLAVYTGEDARRRARHAGASPCSRTATARRCRSRGATRWRPTGCVSSATRWPGGRRDGAQAETPPKRSSPTSSAGRHDARAAARPVRRSSMTRCLATSRRLPLRRADKVAEAFAVAAHVTAADLQQPDRHCAMEPRAAVGEYDPESGRYTCTRRPRASSGFATGSLTRSACRSSASILATHVGGSFGMKYAVFPEYVRLCTRQAPRASGQVARRALRQLRVRPPRRDNEVTAELALDADGSFLAVRVTGYAKSAPLVDCGPLIRPSTSRKNRTASTRTPLFEVSSQCLFTNTMPIDAYRGAGRPEGNYYMERLVEPPPPNWASTRWSCAAATSSRRTISPTRRRRARSTIAATSRASRPRRRSRGPRRLRGPPGPRARGAESCAGSASASISRWRRRSPTNSAGYGSSRTARHHRHRHARLRPGAPDPVGAGLPARSACRSTRSGSCRAIPTS